MSERHLHDLLREVADTVPAPDLARSAWEEGVRRGRRRRAAHTAGVGTLAAAALVALSALPGVRTTSPPPAPAGAVAVSVPARVATPTPPPSPTAAGNLSRALPSRAEEARLPWVGTLLPRTLAIPVSAPAVSEDPPGRALALLQAAGERPSPVFVLGEDRRYRSLDVELEDTRDADGNTGHPLDPTSLSPDGRRAAFAQPGAVVVVDLRTGEHSRFPAPGLNESVTWEPGSGRLLVHRARGAAELYLGSGVVGPAMSTQGSATYAAGGAAVVELGEGVLRRWELGAPEPERLPLDPRLGNWWGAPRARGERVAASVFYPGYVHDDSYQGVAVIDARAGRTLALLEAPGADRWKGCCAVLGWLTEDRVLLESRGEGPWRLLAWDVRSGSFERVAEADASTRVSLGDLRP